MKLIEKFLAGKQMIIPKKRTVLRTIPLSNGSKLTAEQDTTGLIRGIFWFRDNKYITPLQQKKYKFYDSSIKGYRQLNSFTNMDEKGKLTVSTPLYAPNLDWLSKTSDAESRYKLASKLLIPFKGLKIITLKTKGNMNLADVPVNMLDSIAVNAGRSNTDFWTSAALVGKESTFGGMSKTLHGDNEILYGMEDGKFNPSTLTNNHSYFSSPETDYWNALFNKYLKGVTGSDDEERLKAEADVKYAREHGQIVLRTPQYSLYVLADAFKRYNVAPNKYNPGLKNYASMVNGIKLELQGDRLLQEYWNTRGKLQYARGMKEGMKLGGKFRKFQIGGYVQPSNVLEAINNGSAAGGLLEGFGRVMSKILPKWMLKAGTYMSPLNYAAALSKGSINPKVGEEVISKWHPNILLAARLGEAIFGGKAIKSTPKAVVSTAAKAGVKPAKAAVVAREVNKGIKQNTNNGRIEVTENYFNSPDKWYRITETPEKYGIMELGKNVTTHDAPQTHGTINGWRSSMLRAPITKSSEGFIKRPHKIELGIRRKNGQAHGNTSQAAKGKLWGGTTSGSNLFPEGIIEGQAPSMINYGLDRTNFVMTPWELVPNGGRVGFHTGEMPMSNLGWFQRTNKGTYTYEPIISEKRIEIKHSTKLLRVVSEGTYPIYRGKQHSVREVVNPDGTVNPRQAMRVQHEVSRQFPGSYKMEHRLENPEWHPTDPTTYHHTRNVARSAWYIDPPLGFTKQDLMIAALGHDFGKIVAGDGHALIGADLAKQVFPDLTDAQYTAIAQHMGNPTTPLGKVTKLADISNGRHSYSGYTPTKLNPVQSKFVKDAMLGHKWGMNKKIKPAGNKDFTEELNGKERLGYGAESDVYEDVSNPSQVLKTPSNGNGLVTPHNTLKGAIREGLFIAAPFNRLPYNLPLNVEGAVRTSEGKYIPVFSLRKVYIPLMDQPKIIDFDKSVNGMYSAAKPDINNILLENDIQRAKDFKLPNIGFLSDGTVMGIDLWKKGGKLCQKIK